MTENENWRAVVGWEGFYEVSDFGNVRGTNRQSVRRDGTIQTWKGRILTPFPNSKGYLVVHLSKPGKRLLERVHRMVALAFLPDAHTIETVNHRDGIKLHNQATNLEWATRRENTLHSIENGLGPYTPPLETRFKSRLPAPPTPAED